MAVIRLLVAGLLLAMAGCNPSKRISSWESKDDSSKRQTKLLVLGLVPYAAMEIRENIEATFEEVFQKNEINAVSSLKVFGTTVFERMDEEDALYQLNNNCVDVVMTVTLLNRKKENKYTAGLIHYTPYTYYYDRFWRYRTTIKYRSSEQGYYGDMSDVFLECNLYDMVTQRLIYSVQSRSFSAADVKRETNKFVRMVVRHIVKTSSFVKDKSHRAI